MIINDRIKHLISELGLNNNSFSNAVGVKPTVIYNIVDGRKSAPSYTLLNKIALSFDNIDMNWLITGSGNMLKEPFEASPKPKRDENIPATFLRRYEEMTVENYKLKQLVYKLQGEKKITGFDIAAEPELKGIKKK